MPEAPVDPLDDQEELAILGRAIIDGGDYMTLATADADGRPWATPVWYAPVGYAELLWLSRPEARHSRNLAVRRDLAMVIFDSSAQINTGQAVYIEAVADQVPESELERLLGLFSQRSQARGGPTFTLAEVRGQAPLRLSRAVASAQFVLGADERVPVSLG
jgi:hypothetical protein